MLTDTARERIFEEYGADGWEGMSKEVDFYDSIIPVHCTECGEYITDAEPDARGHECPNGCGTTGEALTEIVLGEVA